MLTMGRLQLTESSSADIKYIGKVCQRFSCRQAA